MNLFALTQELINIESVTGNERRMGDYLAAVLQEMAVQFGGRVEIMDVEPERFNVFAAWEDPVVTLSTHIDTVPPFFPAREDGEFIWGRGACDTKGIIASMLCAVQQLLEAGTRNIGVLFVVGEERNSAGAYAAAKNPRGSKFLINGEPTENKLALGSKGALRLEVEAEGKMAHSAYPQLGDSAINKLLDILQELRTMALPVDPVLGPSTLNIGTIKGGRAPNVIADQASAEVFIRLVDNGETTRQALRKITAGKVQVHEVLCIPALRLGALDGFETAVMAYTTDIPAFAGAWGQPYLLGPGSIHVAHTSEERIPKTQLEEAVQLYQRMVLQLLKS